MNGMAETVVHSVVGCSFHVWLVSESSKKQPVDYRSVISDVFDGRILSSVQCLTCERVCFVSSFFSSPHPSFFFFLFMCNLESDSCLQHQ